MIQKIIDYIKIHKLGALFCVLGTVLVFIAISAIMAVIPYINMDAVTNEALDGLDLDGFDKLMIVAHPDDEFLWGGAHLLDDDYLVVCITGGNNKIRRPEFEEMSAATNSRALILSYPDKIWNKRSDWYFWKNAIQTDLETILNYKAWELVVTHNEDGEYGHNQHIMTHELVDSAYISARSTAKQYYFGTYYVVENLPNELTQISNENYLQKRELVKIYQSQIKTIRKFYHMLPYELWTEKTA